MSLTEDEQESVQRFRKMTTMGLPEPVVRHKMLSEGIEQHVQDAVFSQDDGGDEVGEKEQEEEEPGKSTEDDAPETEVAEQEPESAEGPPVVETVSEEESIEEEEIEVSEEEEISEQEEIIDDDDYETMEEHEISGVMDHAPEQEEQPSAGIYQPPHAQQQQQQEVQQQDPYQPPVFQQQQQQQVPQQQGYYDNTTGQWMPAGDAGYDGYSDPAQQSLILPGEEQFQDEGPDLEDQIIAEHNRDVYFQEQAYDPAYDQGQYPPEQPIEYKDPRAEAEEQKARGRRRCLVSLLVIVVGIFALALAGVGVVLGIWLSGEDDDDPTVLIDTATPREATTPTAAPVTSAPVTIAPTSAPTLGPIVLPVTQQFSGPEGSGHGTSVAASGEWVAISEPDLGEGLVKLYQNEEPDAQRRRLVVAETQNLTGPSAGSRFGADLDFSNVAPTHPYLVVGAPEAFLGETSTPAGAAFFYTYNITEEEWVQQGSAMTGGLLASNENEKFGTSVALSDAFRVAIGAPEYGTDSDRTGQVYTYSFEQLDGSDSFDWVALSQTPLLGSSSGSGYGSAVDITASGNSLAVGEPGNSRFLAYDWNAATAVWDLKENLDVPDAVDLGSDVKFLSENFLAVGAPSAEQGKGVILVFQRLPLGNWGLVGNQITGGEGDALGTFGTFDGTVGSSGPELVVGTATGLLQRYDFVDGSWQQRYSEDLGSPITSVDIASDGETDSVIVGFGSSATAALLEEQIPTPAPSSAPTPAPTNSPPAGGWTVTTEGTTPRGEPTDFGSSIAMAGTTYMVTGEPRFGENFVKEGQLIFFERSGAGEPFVDQNVLVDSTEISVEQFGRSVDMILDEDSNLPLLAVGSTRTKGLEQTNDRFGAGFYYEYNANTTTFEPVGGTLRGDETLGETGGSLGFSVALAQTSNGIKRMALASPVSSLHETNTLDVGRIYTYELNETMEVPVWERMADPLIGAEQAFLGSGIDLSQDGTLLVAGAPGSLPADGTAAGKVSVYLYNSASALWESLTVTSGAGTSTESLGSTVQFIEEQSSTWFATGAPTFANNTGMVRVYQQSGETFAPLGNDIVGDAPGDLLGDTLCGRNGRLATGKASGEFSVYEYNGSTWEAVGAPFTPVENSTVVACAMSDDGNALTVGTDTFQIVVYDLL
mmetsp:Transcript_30091/g.82649  ORF Transcript_30091/g.82649 Transcript_30091/m.82649 type:complete len:1156 (-) Transcript_30091:79-3546(-)